MSARDAPEIRPATEADDRELAEIDQATWSPSVTPADRWPPDRSPLSGGVDPTDVLVAELDGVIAGYLHLAAPTPLPSNRHVIEVRGLAVRPSHQRLGVARRLLAVAVEEARRRGARRLTLRVFAGNTVARRLYESAGFEIEGVLREEFLIEGEFVDDVLMAMNVAYPSPADSSAASSSSSSSST